MPFTPGRGDATQEQTDVDSFAWLEPRADGFRNYLRPDAKLPAENLLVDKAYLLSVTAPEMTVLVGGLRVLGANVGGVDARRPHRPPGPLTNDFFVNLLALGTVWSLAGSNDRFEASTGGNAWTGPRVDLVFGSNSELRAVAEVYAQDGAEEKFVHDFVAAWAKVMDNDRYDLRPDASRRRRQPGPRSGAGLPCVRAGWRPVSAARTRWRTSRPALAWRHGRPRHAQPPLA